MAVLRQINRNPAYQYLLTNIDVAVGRLQRKKLTDATVHDARKALKKARAALRLLQDGMPKQSYRRENLALRNAGRCLSPLRDAKSVIGALTSLHKRYGDELAGPEMDALEKAFRADLMAVRARLADERRPLADCNRLLKDARRRAQRERFGEIDLEASESGLRRIYRKGRKALAAAQNRGSADALHEWRKQVKYLLNSIDDSMGVTNGVAKQARKRADRLADRLGEDHDLAVLTLQAPQRKGSAVAVKALLPVILRRRRKLQKDALRLGRKLYKARARQAASRLLKHG